MRTIKISGHKLDSLGVKCLNIKIFSLLSMILVLTLLMMPVPASSQFNAIQVMPADYQYNQ